MIKVSKCYGIPDNHMKNIRNYVIGIIVVSSNAGYCDAFICCLCWSLLVTVIIEMCHSLHQVLLARKEGVRYMLWRFKPIVCRRVAASAYDMVSINAFKNVTIDMSDNRFARQVRIFVCVRVFVISVDVFVLFIDGIDWHVVVLAL